MKLTLTNLVIGALVAYVIYVMFFRREGMSDGARFTVLVVMLIVGIIIFTLAFAYARFFM